MTGFIRSKTGPVNARLVRMLAHPLYVLDTG